MNILDTVFRRREPAVKYRTIDGGHPAPYPDMTDEQLYNYEMTFDVPKKTFDKPPGMIAVSRTEAQAAGRAGASMRGHDGAHETAAAASRTTTMRSTTVRRTVPPRAGAVPASGQPESGIDSTRSAPRPAALPLDLSRPVRTVTTRQPVEIITTRARHPLFKVLGYIGDDQVVTMFTLDGQISENGPPFLENVPHKQFLYLNIYPNRSMGGRERFFLTQHETRESADAAATAERIACVPVEFDLL